MRWPKYWSFSFRICPSSEHSGLISFRMDQFVLLAVQGTLKSLLQHHNSKASILQQSAFFMVQLSLPYIATGKTIALIISTCMLLSRGRRASLATEQCELIEQHTRELLKQESLKQSWKKLVTNSKLLVINSSCKY